MSVLTYVVSNSAGNALDDGSASGSVEWKMLFRLLRDMHTGDHLLLDSGIHTLVRAGSVICRFGTCVEEVDLHR